MLISRWFCGKNRKKKITVLLSKLLEHYLNPNNDTRIYIAKEVTFDYTSNNKTRVDYMRFKPLNNSVSGIEKADVYCYEIKSSVEDFKSKNGHNFIGDYNYYVMPDYVYDEIKKEIPLCIGVYTCDINSSNPRLIQIQKSRRKNREKSLMEILLMMFRSSNRELIKTLTTV